MKATWEDEQGRRHAVEVPPGQEHLARQGIPLGPPDLSKLETPLPLDVEVRLHNALHDRGIITPQDASRRPQDVHAAILFAFKINVQQVQNLYLEDNDGQ